MNEDLGLGVIVSMKDAFSQNAGHVESSMRSLDSTVAASSERMTRNMDRIQQGAMMMGAGLALMALPVGLIASTAATQKALGELSSLGVRDLRAIEDAAEAFTNTWAGSSKAEFITASYDVRSALSGLTDEAVGSFTAMAALTGKATKATTEEMVGTFTTTYGIFKPIMTELSDAEWARTFAGAMAQTVASFKTNGRQMADAIKNIGAVAASSNVPLQEQLAILGQLQTTMPGTEAGTLYKAFIMKAAEAGEKLGLELVGSSGRLKGVVPILQEIQGKFPDLSQAAAQVEIKKAFGSDEAVKFLLQMSQGVAALETNIRSVERAMRTGTAVTEEMARSMNLDIGARLKLVGQQMGNLAEILGRTLLPVVTPVLDAFGRVIVFFQDLARSAPGLTRVLLTLSIALGVVLAVYLLKKAWDTNFGGIRDSILGAWGRIKLVFGAIRELISSLTGGMGEMSAELAQKLEQAGLLGLVVTVFRVYYRVRQFLAGLRDAFARAFGQIRTILEPPVRALVAAFGRLLQAIGSVTRIFTVAADSADASVYRTLGATLGSVLGVIAKIGAFLLKFVVYGLVGVIEVIAWVVGAFARLAKAAVTAGVKAGQFLYKFFLPLRLLVESLRMVGRIAATLWRVLAGDLSVTDGLKAVGRAVVDYLATPFRWARDVVTGVWDFVRGLFGSFGRFVAGAAAGVLAALRSMPLVRTLSDVFGAVGRFLAGDTTFFEAGKRILVALGKGIWAAVTYPFDVLKRALGRLRSLLPFSDAETGPLSDLTASGAAILRTLAQGMTGVLGLPGRVLARVFARVRGSAVQGWQVLQSLGPSAVQAVAAPFTRIADAASGAWRRIAGMATTTWNGLQAGARRVGEWITAPFDGLAAAANSAFAGARRHADTLWQAVAGGRSVLDGLRAIGGVVESLVASPIERARDGIAGVWSVLRTGFSDVGRFARSAAADLLNVFRELPLAGTLAEAFSAARDFLAGDTTFFEAGRRMLMTLGQGIVSAAAVPFELFKRALGKLRSLLPFSDAQTGPLSNLTASGAAILKTLGQGMAGVLAMPGAVLGQAFHGMLSAAHAGWQQLRSLGASAVDAVAAPFHGIAEAASTAWIGITTTAADAWSGLRSMAQSAGQWMKAPFAGLATAASSAWDQVKAASSGAWEVVQSKVAGLARAAAESGQAVRANAAGGSTLLQKLAGGIAQAAALPGQAIAGALSWMNEGMRRIATPAMLTGTLALTPVVAGLVPQAGSPPLATEPRVVATRPAAPSQGSRLLAETRGSLAPGTGASGEPAGDDVRSILEALLGKLDALTDRPIDVSVTTLLDSRQVAQSVYRDIRERKIKNYETL